MRINKLIAEQPWVLAVGVALLVILWMASGVIGSDPESRLKITETVGRAEGLTRVQISSQSAEPVVRQI